MGIGTIPGIVAPQSDTATLLSLWTLKHLLPLLCVAVDSPVTILHAPWPLGLRDIPMALLPSGVICKQLSNSWMNREAVSEDMMLLLSTPGALNAQNVTRPFE